MYVGHMAAGFIVKARIREAPLAWVLAGTVLSDLLCGLFMVFGLESAEISGEFTFGHVAAYIGYSHSLLSSCLQAVAAGVVASRLSKSARVGIAVGIAVLSHYVLDVVSHWPDMPLIGFGAQHDIRFGTGLAGLPLMFYLVEFALSVGACLLFDPANRRLLGTMFILMVLYSNTVFGFAPPPVPPSYVFGVAMLATFSVTPAVLWWAARSGTTHR